MTAIIPMGVMITLMRKVLIMPPARSHIKAERRVPRVETERRGVNVMTDTS